MYTLFANAFFLDARQKWVKCHPRLACAVRRDRTLHLDGIIVLEGLSLTEKCRKAESVVPDSTGI